MAVDELPAIAVMVKPQRPSSQACSLTRPSRASCSSARLMRFAATSGALLP